MNRSKHIQISYDLWLRAKHACLVVGEGIGVFVSKAVEGRLRGMSLGADVASGGRQEIEVGWAAPKGLKPAGDSAVETAPGSESISGRDSERIDPGVKAETRKRSVGDIYKHGDLPQTTLSAFFERGVRADLARAVEADRAAVEPRSASAAAMNATFRGVEAAERVAAETFVPASDPEPPYDPPAGLHDLIRQDIAEASDMALGVMARLVGEAREGVDPGASPAAAVGVGAETDASQAGEPVVAAASPDAPLPKTVTMTMPDGSTQEMNFHVTDGPCGFGFTDEYGRQWHGTAKDSEEATRVMAELERLSNIPPVVEPRPEVTKDEQELF